MGDERKWLLKGVGVFSRTLSPKNMPTPFESRPTLVWFPDPSAFEALTVLVQYYALLSPRQREQLLFPRFINTSGKEGTNKASDLHMEYLNSTVKTAIGNQSSNLTPKVLTRIGKCAGPV